MVKPVKTYGEGTRVTRKNTHTDRLSAETFHLRNKKAGAGKANWGRPGDELNEVELDVHDPAYDSADELFDNAFGGKHKNTQYDWAQLNDLSSEDSDAMDQIEETMREQWMQSVEAELADDTLQDEGEAFFHSTSTL
mmetsp:Transcript_3353/g.5379  ORF Transcript_3353/g.5379 Transcript_3353/m.5379 type:complete len:137 (-) Transcript_3353:258-668(-)|eukprot:CAMPEP_0184291282 /NCGR_PEP_ID=MMETSP1049-20130417/3343_1 /TAXON_ID=77928 /ORGANISM="Proteomonas sulcata, Strain CCMP704" /LENGTH=136 /DNA_ID=CAMNT_0026598685 /DNA_START=376 /DNA_END=786 /DNA_ORIENTATION=+